MMATNGHTSLRRCDLRVVVLLALSAPFIGCGNDASDDALTDVDDASCDIADFPAPELCARAGADSVVTVADRLVVLDESGSMRPIWHDALDALDTLRATMPASASLSLVTFADSARYVGTVSAGTLDSLRATTPAGERTDLGQAAEAVIDRVRGSDRRTTFVSILTDGEHDPPQASIYPIDCAGDPWATLREQITSASEQPGRAVLVTLVPIGIYADVHCLELTFPRADTCDDGIADCVARAETDAAMRYLRRRVEQDLAAAGGIVRSDGPVRTIARLPAHAILQTDNERALIDTCWDGAEAPLPNGGSIQLNGCVAAVAPGGGDSRMGAGERPGGSYIDATVINGAGNWYDWLLPAGGRDHAVQTSAALETRFEPAGEIDSVMPGQVPVEDSVEIALDVEQGLATWLFIGILAALLAAIGLYLWARLPPVPPRLYPTAQLTRYGITQPLDLERLGPGPDRFEIPTPVGDEPGTATVVLEIRRRRRLGSRNDILCRIHPSDHVQVGVARPGMGGLSLNQVLRPVECEPKGYLIWDPPESWGAAVAQAKIDATLTGYRIASP